MLDVGAMKVSGISSETIPQDEARRLIERFRDAQDITTKRILAMQISNDYAARLLLKNEFKDIGRQYFAMWFGEDGLANYIIRRTQAKLSGFPPEVVDRIRVIQNEKSLLEMSAPMDLDAGVIADSADDSRRLLHQLGGPARAREFEEALQTALEESYNEVYGTIGGSGRLNPKRGFITGTSPWHPEAYLDRKVLQGGVAGKDLIQQTADVTKAKVREMERLYGESVLTLDEAMTEAMRGTAKDLDKVNRVFDRLEKVTGVRPKFSAQQEAIAEVMRKVRNMEMTGVEANKEIIRISGGRLSAFSACDSLIDTMEEAWRLRKIKPQERLLWLFAELLDDAQYSKALKASLEEAGVFPSDAKRVIDELAGAGKARTLSIDGGTIDEFLDDMVRDFPTTKIAGARGSDSLKELLKEMESGTSIDDLVKVLGQEKAEQLTKIRGYMTAKVKAQIKLRYSKNKFLIWEVDKKSGEVLFGDAGRGMLMFDAGIGLAMAFSQTASIMDEHLSPEEESRKIMNAWATSLPIVGDFAMGMIEGIEGYFEGDRGKIAKSAVWLTIGAAGVVPGLQAPALVAGLGMAGYEAASGYYDIRKDKDLIAAWLASGKWDEKKGLLLALLDSADKPHEVSWDGIIRDGMVWYKSGLEGISIRDSMYMYVERSGLESNQSFQSYIRGLKALYPDFEFDKALREPLPKGKELFAQVVTKTEPAENRSVQMLMFVRAKQIIDAEVNKAAQSIQGQVEAEYQARYRVGEAARVFEELRKVGDRLGLPLEKNVNDLFNSFSNFVVQLAKNPWVRESIARRRVQHAEKYLQGYLEIEKSLSSIGKVFDKAGVQKPKFNLTGFLEIDGPRIRDLEAAYNNKALREVGLAVQDLHREFSGDPGYLFNPNSPDACDAELFKQLANIRVRIVEAEDRKLLFEQWAGKQSAALASRDQSLRRAQESADAAKGQSVITIPSAIWQETCEGFESAYAWTNGTIEGTEGTFAEAIQLQSERIARLNAEYTTTLKAGRGPMEECLAKVPSGKIELSIAAPKIGERVNARLVFLAGGKTPVGGEWNWTATGGVNLVGRQGESVDLSASSAGTLTAHLRVGTKEVTSYSIEISPGAGATPSPSPDQGSTGNIRIEAPLEIFAVDLVDAKAMIPADLRSRAASAEWYPKSCTGTPQLDNAKLQFENPRDGKPSQTSIWYTLKDASNGNIGSGSRNLLVKPVLFGGTAASIWKASSGPAGVAVEREPAIRKFQDKDSGVVRARVEVVWADSFVPKTFEEIQAEMTKAKGGNEGLALTPITIAGFKGFLLERKEIKQGATGSGYVDLGLPDTELGGWGYAIKNCIVIKFSYSATGGGVIRGEWWAVWWNDVPFLRSQTRAAATEAKAVLAGLTLGPDGKFDKTPYKGPKLDGSDTPTVKLVLSPDKKKLRKGEIVNVQAVIENEENAEKPFKYDWSGEHAGSGAAVQFLATAPGKQRLGVVVPNIGGASIEFEVEDLKAVIKQVTPASPKVVVGSPATFTAQLLSGGQPATGNYIYRWQPTPDVKFEPSEGPGDQAKAVFSRPGMQKVFVQVLEKKGEILQTLAESEQIEIEVIKPDFKITFAPPAVMVGKEVKAKVEVTPSDLKDIDLRWEVTSNAKQTLESQDKREITLVPQDTKPVTVTVTARVPFTGDDLGKQTATITASKLDVKAIVLGAEGPKPQVWKEGVGLVPLETGIAVGQFVGLRAEVTPAQEGLRYEWSLNEDSHFAGNSLSQQIRVSRSQTGTCEATVIVRDKNGLELGRGAATFDVTVSQADLNNAKAKAAAATKVAEAKQLASQGKLDEAIAAADQAASLDPKNSEAPSLSGKLKGDRAGIQDQLGKVRSLADQGKFPEAIKELDAAKKINPKYQPVIDADSYVAQKKKDADTGAQAAAALIKTGQAQHDARNYAAAVATFDKAIAANPSDPEGYRLRGRSKRETGDLSGSLSDLNTAIKLAPNDYQAVLGRGLTKQRMNDSAGAMADFTRGIQLNPTYAGGYAYRGYLKLGQKDYQGAKADYDQAIAIDPGNANYYINRGNTRSALKDHRGAISDYDRALSIDPRNAITLNNRGWSKEQLGDLTGALADYEASLAIDPNYGTAKANLANLKSKLGTTPPVEPKVEPGKATFLPLDLTQIGGKKGVPHELKGIQVDDGSYARLKSTDEKKLTYTVRVPTQFEATSVAIVSHLDDSIHLTDGMTITRMTVIKNTGEERFDIKAGVHSSEWNRSDGPKHKAAEPLQVFKLARSGTVTAVRFDYVENNVEKWWGHAPGFVLKGLTLVGQAGASTVTPPKPVDQAYLNKFTGRWNSEWGIIDFKVVGSSVTGTYPHDNGRIEATISDDGRTMVGTWSESPSYKPPNDAGRVTFTLSPDGKTISGHYWFGQDRDGGAWTGTRLLPSATGTPAPTPRPSPIPATPKPTPTPASKVVELLSSMNSGGVSNSPTAPAQFDTNRTYMISSIMTYHWNNGRGTSRPGTISIRASNGRVYGPYAATGLPAGSVPNAFWEVKPNIALPPGNYVIVDSDPTTWAHNSQSGGRGFTTIRGYLVTDSGTNAPTAVTPPTVAAKAGYITAVFENRSNEAVHILGEEGMFAPENKLAPGERREVQLKMTPTGKMQFIAGRNGQVIAQKYWNGDPKNMRAYPRVVFDGRALQITTGSR